MPTRAKAPTNCDTCGAPITTVFFDARIPGGPWANMCPACFSGFGCALGTGRGQRFEQSSTGKDFVCTAGSSLSKGNL